ncbi:MAG: hypothetical protein Q7T38_07600 [Gallionella sp.]|nr:hypothetical protein [Gallionella sp.]
MQPVKHIPMSPEARLNAAERATGQKNYVHARLQAERTQMNAQAGTPSAKVLLAVDALHTDDAASKTLFTTK